MSNVHGYANPYTVAASDEATRVTFIRKTYLALAAAVAAFIALETVLLTVIDTEGLVRMMSGSSMIWLAVLGVFMVAQTISHRWASHETSKGMQIAGLGILVVAYGIIFLPILTMATKYTPNGSAILAKAGLMAAFLFAGLTTVALTTKKDFSFLSGFLKIGGFVAIGMIVASMFFPGFALGDWFAYAMIILSAGGILYTSGNMVHHYNPSQHIAAAAGLFGSVMMMFYYILMLFLNRD